MSEASSEILLEAKGIQKTFKKGKLLIPVLRGVDFSIVRGESVAIVGASGAGKSTLLHILGTLEEPTAGKVFFEGKDVFAGSEDERSRFRNRHLGFVFQFHYLLPEFTALENVAMAGLIAGRHEKFLNPLAEELLTEVGLAHRLHHKPGELSGGESQRVAVARALMMKPELMLGDELTGNLDSENSNNLISLLLELNRRRGVSLVVVTHDVALAKKMSRVVEMRDGRLVS
ncbi:MAG: ABC transporter ATP-binding protein [Deltaproteobacteria bacterium]|nr:ABC transporter ATP-binding protein [Deltaproteobacteria bacterium]